MPTREPVSHSGAFLVARNPDEGSALPYLLRVPIDGDLWLKARETWPRSSRVYCHPSEAPDISALEIVEAVPVVSCVRRGPAIDLILARGVNKRSQFITTRVKGRSATFWQTSRATSNSRPGLRLAATRVPVSEATFVIDTRERYGYRLAGNKSAVVREPLLVGDYAVRVRGEIVAAVERKAMENLCADLSDGSLGYTMAHLATLRCAAVVVEGTYSQLLRWPHVRAGWFAELIARLQARYPSVPIVFTETRKLGEEWTRRFLAAAAAEFATPGMPLEIPVNAGGSSAIAEAKAFIRRAQKRKRPAPTDNDKPER